MEKDKSCLLHLKVYLFVPATRVIVSANVEERASKVCSQPSRSRRAVSCVVSTWIDITTRELLHFIHFYLIYFMKQVYGSFILSQTEMQFGIEGYRG